MLSTDKWAARVLSMGARELIKSAVNLHGQGNSNLREYARICLACLEEVGAQEPLAPYQRLRKLATAREEKARSATPVAAPSPVSTGSSAGQGQGVTEGRGPLAPYQRRALRAGLISPDMACTAESTPTGMSSSTSPSRSGTPVAAPTRSDTPVSQGSDSSKFAGWFRK